MMSESIQFLGHFFNAKVSAVEIHFCQPMKSERCKDVNNGIMSATPAVWLWCAITFCLHYIITVSIAIVRFSHHSVKIAQAP